MGLEVDKVAFDDRDRQQFAERLDASVDALATLLERPGFGEGAASLGAELELSLVDASARPLMRNSEVLEASLDPRLTVELDRFNLEANLRHGPLAGASLSKLVDECNDCVAEVERAAALHGASGAMIGILPTLTADDLGPESMTSSLRYEALSTGLRALRDEPFLLDIHGDDHLFLACNDVSYEGAATSFQIHLRVEPREFARVYDAIQLATPIAVAISGNAPTFLGRRLWDETRIALFKQAVDHRVERGAEGRPARVSFGSQWTDDALDLFRETVARHAPLLPVMDGEDPRDVLAASGTPRLRELRLHQGTVWRWNRAIYDPVEGGHLRVEMRALPSGPSVVDMVANAAFLIGLALDAAETADVWRRELPFDRLHGDFYRAARLGLDAQLVWPKALGGTGRPCRAQELLPQLVQRARDGLGRAGVDASDSDAMLAMVERRAATGQTGANWQRAALARAERDVTRDEAIVAMFRTYLERSRTGEPVADWKPWK